MKPVNLKKLPAARSDTYVCILTPRTNAQIMLATVAAIKAARLSRAS